MHGPALRVLLAVQAPRREDHRHDHATFVRARMLRIGIADGMLRIGIADGMSARMLRIFIADGMLRIGIADGMSAARA